MAFFPTRSISDALAYLNMWQRHKPMYLAQLHKNFTQQQAFKKQNKTNNPPQKPTYNQRFLSLFQIINFVSLCSYHQKRLWFPTVKGTFFPQYYPVTTMSSPIHSSSISVISPSSKYSVLFLSQL